MATNSVEREIARESGEEENDQTDAQPGRCLSDRMAEDISEPGPSPGPYQGAHGAIADKARGAHPCHAGQSGRNRVQLRQEPSGEVKCRGVGQKDRSGATDQGSSSRRDSTEYVQRPRAAPSAQAV